MEPIASECPVLARSLWSATASPAPEHPPLRGSAEADVVVIGGGFTGLSAALHLAEPGRAVVLLEVETPGWGASGRNGGQVNPGLKATPEEIEARFGPAARPPHGRDDGCCGRSGLRPDRAPRHQLRCGWIRAATTPRAMAGLAEVGRQWRARGAEVDALDAGEMERCLGTRAYLGGLIDRRGGNLHPLNYALGLAAAAERLGGRIHGGSRVTGINATDDSVTVSTTAGQVTVRTALICTNAYTGPPPRRSGVRSCPSPRCRSRPNRWATTWPERSCPKGIRPRTPPAPPALFFRKGAQGRFVMGGRGATGVGSIRARQAALRLYPQLEGADWSYAWGGDVVLTRDHLPGLHRLAPRVMAGLGYNGRGVGMATAMGRVLAGWAAGRPEAELDFPVTPARPIPFHHFRWAGLGATVAVFRVFDRIGV